MTRTDAILESARRIQLIAFDMCGSNRAALMQEVSALRDLAREDGAGFRIEHRGNRGGAQVGAHRKAPFHHYMGAHQARQEWHSANLSIFH